MGRRASLDTLLVHAGEPRPRIGGAVCLPIFQSAMFEHPEGRAGDPLYIRLSNTPNHEALHAKLAALEKGGDALAAASGMAAISAALLAVLKSGDHLLAQEGLYGGTHGLLTEDLPRLGIAVDLVPGDDPAAWRARLRPRTRAFYVEAITNPTLQVADHAAVVSFCRQRGLVSLIDSTFATPVNFRPLERGYDVALHSGTKYLNGHSDVVAGAVVGPAAWIARMRRVLKRLGGALDPHACFLLHRGLKTLGVRVRRQNETALAVARFLESRPEVARVNYPGLESHPHHARARALFDGFGGVLSFEPRGGAPAARRLVGAVRLPVAAPSLGGIETLITRPVATSHRGVPPAERRRLGIGEGLVRLSVGLESPEDICADLGRALVRASRRH